jgi:hypothetical protein
MKCGMWNVVGGWWLELELSEWQNTRGFKARLGHSGPPVGIARLSSRHTRLLTHPQKL